MSVASKDETRTDVAATENTDSTSEKSGILRINEGIKSGESKFKVFSFVPSSNDAHDTQKCLDFWDFVEGRDDLVPAKAFKLTPVRPKTPRTDGEREDNMDWCTIFDSLKERGLCRCAENAGKCKICDYDKSTESFCEDHFDLADLDSWDPLKKTYVDVAVLTDYIQMQDVMLQTDIKDPEEIEREKQAVLMDEIDDLLKQLSVICECPPGQTCENADLPEKTHSEYSFTRLNKGICSCGKNNCFCSEYYLVLAAISDANKEVVDLEVDKVEKCDCSCLNFALIRNYKLLLECKIELQSLWGRKVNREVVCVCKQGKCPCSIVVKLHQEIDRIFGWGRDETLETVYCTCKDYYESVLEKFSIDSKPSYKTCKCVNCDKDFVGNEDNLGLCDDCVYKNAQSEDCCKLKEVWNESLESATVNNFRINSAACKNCNISAEEYNGTLKPSVWNRRQRSTGKIELLKKKCLLDMVNRGGSASSVRHTCSPCESKGDLEKGKHKPSNSKTGSKQNLKGKVSKKKQRNYTIDKDHLKNLPEGVLMDQETRSLMDELNCGAAPLDLCKVDPDEFNFCEQINVNISNPLTEDKCMCSYSLVDLSTPRIAEKGTYSKSSLTLEGYICAHNTPTNSQEKLKDHTKTAQEKHKKQRSIWGMKHKQKNNRDYEWRNPSATSADGQHKTIRKLVTGSAGSRSPPKTAEEIKHIKDKYGFKIVLKGREKKCKTWYDIKTGCRTNREESDSKQYFKEREAKTAFDFRRNRTCILEEPNLKTKGIRRCAFKELPEIEITRNMCEESEKVSKRDLEDIACSRITRNAKYDFEGNRRNADNVKEFQGKRKNEFETERNDFADTKGMKVGQIARKNFEERKTASTNGKKDFERAAKKDFEEWRAARTYAKNDLEGVKVGEGAKKHFEERKAARTNTMGDFRAGQTSRKYFEERRAARTYAKDDSKVAQSARKDFEERKGAKTNTKDDIKVGQTARKNFEEGTNTKDDSKVAQTAKKDFEDRKGAKTNTKDDIKLGQTTRKYFEEGKAARPNRKDDFEGAKVGQTAKKVFEERKAARTYAKNDFERTKYGQTTRKDFEERKAAKTYAKDVGQIVEERNAAKTNRKNDSGAVKVGQFAGKKNLSPSKSCARNDDQKSRSMLTLSKAFDSKDNCGAGVLKGRLSDSLLVEGKAATAEDLGSDICGAIEDGRRKAGSGKIIAKIRKNSADEAQRNSKTSESREDGGRKRDDITSSTTRANHPFTNEYKTFPFVASEGGANGSSNFCNRSKTSPEHNKDCESQLNSSINKAESLRVYNAKARERFASPRKQNCRDIEEERSTGSSDNLPNMKCFCPNENSPRSPPSTASTEIIVLSPSFKNRTICSSNESPTTNSSTSKHFSSTNITPKCDGYKNRPMKDEDISLRKNNFNVGGDFEDYKDGRSNIDDFKVGEFCYGCESISLDGTPQINNKRRSSPLKIGNLTNITPVFDNSTNRLRRKVADDSPNSKNHQYMCDLICSGNRPERIASNEEPQVATKDDGGFKNAGSSRRDFCAANAIGKDKQAEIIKESYMIGSYASFSAKLDKKQSPISQNRKKVLREDAIPQKDRSSTKHNRNSPLMNASLDEDFRNKSSTNDKLKKASLSDEAIPFTEDHENRYAIKDNKLKKEDASPTKDNGSSLIKKASLGDDAFSQNEDFKKKSSTNEKKKKTCLSDDAIPLTEDYKNRLATKDSKNSDAIPQNDKSSTKDVNRKSSPTRDYYSSLRSTVLKSTISKNDEFKKKNIFQSCASAKILKPVKQHPHETQNQHRKSETETFVITPKLNRADVDQQREQKQQSCHCNESAGRGDEGKREASSSSAKDVAKRALGEPKTSPLANKNAQLKSEYLTECSLPADWVSRGSDSINAQITPKAVRPQSHLTAAVKAGNVMKKRYPQEEVINFPRGNQAAYYSKIAVENDALGKGGKSPGRNFCEETPSPSIEEDANDGKLPRITEESKREMPETIGVKDANVK